MVSVAIECGMKCALSKIGDIRRPRDNRQTPRVDHG
jgi:hypothetical protein